MKTAVFFILLSLTAFLQAQSSKTYQSRLWLPIAYEKEFTRLIEAAKKVDEHEQCHKLVNGTLHESQTTPEQIVFIFRCRNQQNTINLLYVDAEKLSINSQSEIWSKDNEKKRQEHLRRILMNREKYWGICEQEIHKIWKNFNQPSAVGRMPPRPDITEDAQLVYRVEFTTLSPNNNTLSYIATAKVGEVGVCEIKIKPI